LEKQKTQEPERLTSPPTLRPRKVAEQPIDNEFFQKLGHMMEAMKKLFEECKKALEVLRVPEQNRSILSRRSSKRPTVTRKEISPTTEQNEFDDKKIFSPMTNKSLHVVG
jgi:hypothetical protein